MYGVYGFCSLFCSITPQQMVLDDIVLGFQCGRCVLTAQSEIACADVKPRMCIVDTNRSTVQERSVRGGVHRTAVKNSSDVQRKRWKKRVFYNKIFQ